MLMNPIIISDVLKRASDSQISGMYEEGLKELQFFWNYQTPEFKPVTNNLDRKDIGALQFACGMLYGLYAINIKNGQEVSKNLLTAAYNIFVELKDIEYQLYCCNYLALSYWRMSSLDEATAYLDISKALEYSENPLGKLHTIIVESLIDITNRQHKKVLTDLNKSEFKFEQSGDVYLLGMYYLNRGIAKEVLSDFNGALGDLFRAGDNFAELGNRFFLISAENNLACLYRARGEFKNAYKYADLAIKNATLLGDNRRIGRIWDTHAVIALQDCKFELALDYADKAIRELQKTEFYNDLIESYETKINILLQLGHINEALEVYTEASSIARQFASADICRRLTHTVSQFIQEKYFVKVFHEGHSASSWDKCRLEFDVPPDAPVCCVEIHSNRYSEMGLEKGFLAVIEKSEVKNGEFVAVLNKRTNSCQFGFVDILFGLIQLDTCVVNNEILYFSPEEGKVLGKVIGYCPYEPEADGSLYVVPLDL